jgi:hypothetical protein
MLSVAVDIYLPVWIVKVHYRVAHHTGCSGNIYTTEYWYEFWLANMYVHCISVLPILNSRGDTSRRKVYTAASHLLHTSCEGFEFSDHFHLPSVRSPIWEVLFFLWWMTWKFKKIRGAWGEIRCAWQAHGSVVAWGTVLQEGWFQVRILMRSLDFQLT